MHVYRHFQDFLRPPKGSVVAIGSFDGLHRGHQLLFERVRRIASEKRALAGAVTFDPHPAQILAPRYSPPLLMSAERRALAMGNLGLDFVLMQEFDESFARLSAAEFSKELLADHLATQAVVVGDDFTFGRDREGLTGDLVDHGRQFGFCVEVVRRMTVEGMIVSSTRIRSFLLQGNVKGAGLLLGRQYVVAGEVVSGAGRGRHLGYPTVNLKPGGQILPARGVYLSHFWPPGCTEAMAAVTNVGLCPTFGPGELGVEVHVLDQRLDELCGRAVVVGFLQRLRAEQRFDSPADLVQQIGRDVVAARELIGNYESLRELDPLHGIRGPA